MWTEENTKAMAEGLMRVFLSRAERAKLNKATLTELVGVSRARFSALEKNPNLSLHAFIRIQKACEAIGTLLDDGTLPASSSRGPGQEKARDDVLERM